ncbi:MAG: hypothetical protein FWE49_06695, partial [Synergistaceae bacterium]|nr:hypothetical protein [Synergistaceae bacterium]
VAGRAAQFCVSSGTLSYSDEAAARKAVDQIVNRVVNDLLLEPGKHDAGEHYPLYKHYMDNPDFKARLEDYAFVKAYLEPKNATRGVPSITEPPPGHVDPARLAKHQHAAVSKPSAKSDAHNVPVHKPVSKGKPSLMLSERIQLPRLSGMAKWGGLLAGWE